MLYGTVPFKADNMKDLNKLILKGTYGFIGEISHGILFYYTINRCERSYYQAAEKKA